MMNKINNNLTIPNTLTVKDFIFKFYDKNECPPNDVANVLSILIHSCPEHFSTVNYFGVSEACNIYKILMKARKHVFTFYPDAANEELGAISYICTDYYKHTGAVDKFERYRWISSYWKKANERHWSS